MSTLFSIDIDEGTKIRGYLAIDSLINSHSCGGLGIIPDLSPDYFVQAARTMTLKYTFLGIPLGGAKAGIVADPEMPFDEKRELLKSFGRAIRPILQTRTYIPGGDIGTTYDDIRAMLVSNGIRVSSRGIKNRTTGFFAGVTVYIAAIRAAEHLGLDMGGCTVAIEGFGDVGSSAALAFWEKGVKVVAVSTIKGAIYAKEGLDIGELIRLHKQAGSNMVNLFSKAERIDKCKLPEMEVDIFCPCAQPYSITLDNAGRVAARIISPGANIPATAEAEQVLFQKGIVSLPDFVANCGGVLASDMGYYGISEEFIQRFIEENFGHRVDTMLKAAEKEGVTIKEYAARFAENRFVRIKEAVERKTVTKSILNFASKLYQEDLVPQQLVKLLAIRRFNSEFEQDINYQW